MKIPSHQIPLLVLQVVFLLSVAIVNPLGDFPLNDDFQYAYPVKSLIEKGTFELAHRFAPNIFLQVLWGYLCCLVAGGFSYTVLRFSTLITALLALTLFYKTANLLARDHKVAWQLTAIFAFTPIFFLSSFSFMTEVPFMALVLGSIYHYLKYSHAGLRRDRLLGFGLALAAFLIRQPGILIVVAFEGLWLWRSRGQSYQGAFGFLLLATLAYLGIEKVLKPMLGTADMYQSVTTSYLQTMTQQPDVFFYRQLKYNTYALVMMGFYCLPLLGALWHNFRDSGHLRRKQIMVLLTMSVAIVMAMDLLGHHFPFNGSIFRNFTLGVNLLIDYNWSFQTIPRLPSHVWMLVAVLASCCAALIIGYFWKNRNTFALQFLLGLWLIYQAAMTIFSYTDRYLILPLALVLLGLSTLRIRWNLGYVLPLGLFIFVSMAGTKDYLRWNRVVKDRYLEMQSDGIGGGEIDAGSPINSHFSGIHPWNEGAQYLFSFTKNDQFQVRDSIAFYRYMSLQVDHIYVLTPKHDKTLQKQ